MQEGGEIGSTQEVQGAKTKRRRAVQDEESVVVVKKATSIRNIPINVSEIIAMLTAPHTSGPRYTIVAAQDCKNAWKIAICALDETQAGSGACTRDGLSIVSIDALIACLMPSDTQFPPTGGFHNLVTHLKDHEKEHLEKTLVKFVYFPSTGVLHPHDNSKPHFLLPHHASMQTLLACILFAAKPAMPEQSAEYWTATSRAFQAFSDPSNLDRLLKDKSGPHSRRMLYLMTVGENLRIMRHKTDATQLRGTEVLLRNVAKWFQSIDPLLAQAMKHSNIAGKTVEIAKSGCDNEELLAFINAARGSGQLPITDLQMFLGEIRWELVRDNRNAQLTELRASDETRPPETSRFAERRAAQWAAEMEPKWPYTLGKLMQMAIEEKYNMKKNGNPGGENQCHLLANSSRLTFSPNDKASKAFFDGIPPVCQEWVKWKVDQNNTVIERASREFLLDGVMTIADESGNETKHGNFIPITGLFTWAVTSIFNHKAFALTNKSRDVQCPPKVFVKVNIDQISEEKRVWFKSTDPDGTKFDENVRGIARQTEAFMERNYARFLYLFKSMNPATKGVECLEAAHSKMDKMFGLDAGTQSVLLYAIITAIFTLVENQNCDHFARESMDIFTFTTEEPESIHEIFDCDAEPVPKLADAAHAAAAATLASLAASSQAEAPAAAAALSQAEALAEALTVAGHDSDDEEESEESEESEEESEESEEPEEESEEEIEEGEVETKVKTPVREPKKVATPVEASKKVPKPTLMDEFNDEVYKNLHAYHEEELGPVPINVCFAQTLRQKSKAAVCSFFPTTVMQPKSPYRILGNADTIKHMINAWFQTDVSEMKLYELSLDLIPLVKEVTVLDHGRVTHKLRAIKNKIILMAYQDRNKHSEEPPEKVTVAYQKKSLRALVTELKTKDPTPEGAAASAPQ
jgi:hypothetical protein